MNWYDRRNYFYERREHMPWSVTSYPETASPKLLVAAVLVLAVIGIAAML